MVHGLNSRKLRQEMHRIDRINAGNHGVTLLKGIEVDILEDGRLDLPDDVLGELDLVVAAVHSKFDLTRQKQTERILRAMERPHFTILAHPTGRLIGEREPYDVDMARVIAAALRPRLLRRAEFPSRPPRSRRPALPDGQRSSACS